MKPKLVQFTVVLKEISRVEIYATDADDAARLVLGGHGKVVTFQTPEVLDVSEGA